MKLICLGPLLQTDLSAQFEEHVTCSDASETGGGVCSEHGTHLVWKVAGDSPVRLQAETVGGAGGGAFQSLTA